MSKCILVIDDDRVSQELVHRVLQANGYEVMVAGDGVQALAVLQQKIPDLILLDVQMPNLDGYGFIRRKTSNPATAKIPVIVLTSMAQTEPLFKRYGAKAYLLKPLKAQDLLEKIKALVPA
ncbi:MAG: response regulator [Candidatus Omnitrophica bacterium]|nr:response regulator [Candidatus Omnitrophota bacterium]MDE2009431.1 response regulator [Candidatus Omnitrophota bacterium]MDE2214642.1 response regulator [Candidatus Omnitrophota bacterium]MDE2231815.1 response regulator [Candidatus Omnitrophota bacterium]